ncbi:S8 family serine peptidase [Thalassotalea nanhaiensis]|uniref:S8 family serine peptidase n=1 Tax=Thalassotalea nanhaiensis TaxID=3065648 RepID=A0ABY9TEY3_9GAMM|nr:S8 family serine peptidase [Colwelliaceae bacterium SQ345]
MKNTFNYAVFASLLAVFLPCSSAVALTIKNQNVHATNSEDVKHIESKTSHQNKKRNVEDLYAVILKAPSLAAYHAKSVSTQTTQAKATQTQAVRKTLNVKSQASKNYIANLKQKQHEVLAQISTKSRRTITPELSMQVSVNAVTARLTAADVTALRALADVKTVQKIKPHKLSTNAGPQHINAPQVWQGTASHGAFKGEGVIVGIIDTGVSASHPSFSAVGDDEYQHINPLGKDVYLGDCALSEYQHYCNDKLIGIWSHPEITNYATYAGDDPIGLDVQGHGSHVASTVGGNIVKDVPVYNVIGDISEQQFSQISGVAPHANIVSYQVCDLDGCWPDITALAVEHAIANGIDVINYSIGGEAISPWYSLDALAMLSAREAGIHVATSAGNMGPEESTLVSPGNAPWLTSVAAITHGRTFTQKTLTVSGSDASFETIYGFSASSAVSGQLVDGNEFNNGDCLRPFDENVLTDKIVICRRGDIPRVEKGNYALTGNAKGMILVNSINEGDQLNIDFHVLPSIHVSYTDGQALINLLAAHSNIDVNISDSSMYLDPQQENIIAPFSSRGPEPVFNQYLAPHVSAPGVSIYAANATYKPHFYGSVQQPEYIFMDGTSMASPHVAGALALIAGLKPEWSPSEAQSALMLTANSVTRDNEGNINSYFDAGAGSIKIDQALNSSLVMDESVENFVNADPNTGGDPQRLNLPALLGNDCMIQCSWQRTFKATTTGSWSIQTNAETAMDITVTPSQFSLAEGDEITLTIETKINEHYTGGYISSAIEFANNDVNYSAPTLPIIASFKRGKFPKDIEITANSNKGSASIKGVVTVATNNVVATAYDLTKVESLEFNLLRDDSDNTNYPYNIFNDDESYFAQAFKVDLDTRYIEVRILNTTSPDLDLYIGSDWNYNGRPDNSYEMSSLICESATATAFEKCVIEFPKIGNYFIAVHNYGDYQSPSNTVDLVELEIIKVGAADGDVSAQFNSAPKHQEDINFSIAWDSDLQHNQQYITAIDLGTSAENPSDIGFMPIRINRSDKSLSLASTKSQLLIGDIIELEIYIDANNSEHDKSYEITLPLEQQLAINNSSEEYTVTDTGAKFTVAMPVNAEAKQLTVALDSSGLAQATSLMLGIDYTLSTNGLEFEVSESFNSIDLIGIPTALINDKAALTINVNEGETVSISGENSINPNVDDALAYMWRQLSGVDLSLSATQGSELTFTAPQVAEDVTVTVELQVTSAGQSSTANATFNIINVKENSGSGGGSTNYTIMLLLLLTVVCRVKKVTI